MIVARCGLIFDWNAAMCASTGNSATERSFHAATIDRPSERRAEARADASVVYIREWKADHVWEFHPGLAEVNGKNLRGSGIPISGYLR